MVISLLPDRLKRLREKIGLTQTQLSEKLAVSRVNYNRYENGERFPDQKTLIQLAEFFNVSTDYLLGRDNQPAPIKCDPIPPQLSQEDAELLEMLRKLKNLPDKDRKEVESYIKYKEQTSSVGTDEQAAAVGK